MVMRFLLCSTSTARSPYPYRFGAFGVSSGTKSVLVRIQGDARVGRASCFTPVTTLTRPDSGQATVAGIDVRSMPERVRHAIGVVGQKTSCTPEATGRENLVMQGEIYGVTGKSLRQRIAELLDRFQLGAAADRPTRGYSGGMQRRLDVAIGLINRPEVLFLDEPTTGLDPEARVELWREIERLAGEQQMTILLTTHYLEEADRLASRLAIVDRGRIVVEGTPDELKSNLQGDSIQIELTQPARADAVKAALAALDGLSDIVVDGTSLRTRAEQATGALPVVLGALESRGLTIASVTVARPSLDDVYLRYAGRVYSDASVARQAAA
jgi:ABC-2 type transport system ATP-binding protein